MTKYSKSRYLKKFFAETGKISWNYLLQIEKKTTSIYITKHNNSSLSDFWVIY